MARVLALKKFAVAIREANGEVLPDDKLDPGCMRLYSYYKPSLEGGRYGIEAKQIVEASQFDDKGVLQTLPQLKIFNFKGTVADETKILTQDFEVMAPQFSIDASKINSYYPPNGHSDEGRILPHIVFNDPHFPWLRVAGEADNLKHGRDPDPVGSTNFRNQVPWLAVIVFDPSELAISPEDAKGLGLVADDGSVTIKSYDALKLPATGAFPMKVQEYFASIKSRVYYEVVYKDLTNPSWVKMQASTEVTNVIFPTKTQIQDLFGNFNDPRFGTLEQYKYLSHVRHINTLGFPDAGVEEEGYFSICVSGTVGNVKTAVPKTQIVHLVSLEHLDATLTPGAHGMGGSAVNRLGLISLFSWTYTVIPGGPSFIDEMQHLAATAQTLKPPTSVLQSLSDSAKNSADQNTRTVSNLLWQRLDRGFTINRWRTATGEESVAFNRGPLTPSVVPQHPKDRQNPSSDGWVGMSMHGKEFQIWDSECGVMDLTYSNAWNLGRLASISDGPFNSALLRFRSHIWKWASSNTRKFVNNVPADSEVVAGISTLVAAMHTITPKKWEGDVSRLNPAVKDEVAPPLSHPTVAPVFAQALRTEVDKATSAGEAIYNDFSKDKAASADWVSIFNWVQDALFLAKIPAHYLFHEPSHIKGPPILNALPATPALPPEALRFFHVDDTWMDCFIDGALSVANHLEPDFDRTRVRIKEIFNYYFQSPVANSGMKPIIPRSGFVLRSAVVKSTPDLRITASTGNWSDTQNKWVEFKDTKGNTHNPIVRLTRLDDFTILCLFECALAEIWHIKLAQPPHQQRFAIASGISFGIFDDKTVKFEARNLFSRNAPKENPEWPTFEVPLDTAKTFFDQNTRCIRPDIIAKEVNTLAQSQDYTDSVPNSAELGLELNDPSYQLDLMNTLAAPKNKKEVPAPYVRQFWVRPGEDPLVSEPSHEISAPHDVKATLIAPNATKTIGKTSAAAAAANTITSSSISIPLKKDDFSHPPLGSVPRPHASRVITNQRMVTSIPAAVGGSLSTPPAQYQAVVCVDYRPPPPMPGTFNGAPIYAPFDYIPTNTKTLLDLMIVVVRITPNTNPNLALSSLDIELPVFDTKTDNTTTEPLFTADPYVGHVRMAHNLRFVPTLYNNALVSGAKPILGIRLLPRSGNKDATIAVANDQRSFEATVRLTTCRIAPIAKSLGLMVATGPKEQRFQQRGRCIATLRETYKTTNPTVPKVIRETKFDVLKNAVKDGIDTDASGRAVDV